MLIGVPKEIKDHEYRVGLTPDSVNEVVLHGHEVIVERGAGAGIGAEDADYTEVGAEIVDGAQAVFERAEMVVKVKEPLAAERAMLREGQVLFTYLHLAPDPEQTEDLVKSKAVCIAYETVTSPAGGLPLLAPMSEVAGRLAVQAAAHALEKVNGGKGMLLGGVPGVLPAKVVIIGGGVVGTHAAHIAMGMGADTWAIDRSAEALKALWRQFGRPLDTLYSTRTAIDRHVTGADVVIGGVLIPGAAAPKLVTADMIRRMKPGLGGGRRGHRPGRLLRDLASHHPQRSDLHRRRRGPLLRRQHAGRGPEDFHLCAQQRDASARAHAREQGLPPGPYGRSASAQRAERARRGGDLLGSRRCARLPVPIDDGGTPRVNR